MGVVSGLGRVASDTTARAGNSWQQQEEEEEEEEPTEDQEWSSFAVSKPARRINMAVTHSRECWLGVVDHAWMWRKLAKAGGA